jgi:hypothetical protein
MSLPVERSWIDSGLQATRSSRRHPKFFAACARVDLIAIANGTDGGEGMGLDARVAQAVAQCCIEQGRRRATVGSGQRDLPCPPEQRLAEDAIGTAAATRLSMEQLDYDLRFRWFAGLERGDPVSEITARSPARDRRADRAGVQRREV